MVALYHHHHHEGDTTRSTISSSTQCPISSTIRISTSRDMCSRARQKKTTTTTTPLFLCLCILGGWGRVGMLQRRRQTQQHRTQRLHLHLQQQLCRVRKPVGTKTHLSTHTHRRHSRTATKYHSLLCLPERHGAYSPSRTHTHTHTPSLAHPCIYIWAVSWCPRPYICIEVLPSE